MKLLNLIALLSLIFLGSCKKKNNDPEEATPTYDTATAYTLSDVSYGSDPEQNMDIYLPANRNSGNTKVFVLIHGGGWSAGDKADYDYFFNSLISLYPNHAIINLNYRLATSSSPAYPKQIDDIQLALDHIQSEQYDLSRQYLLIGSSAGGHLALLYGYTADANHYVKGICNTVGPADITDTAYTNNVIYMAALGSLVGNVTYSQNPTLYETVSPAKHVTASSPKTISFYGDSDPLVPSSQMHLLHDELNLHNVYNESTMYPGEGHGGWSEAHSQDAVLKMINFINQHFN